MPEKLFGGLGVRELIAAVAGQPSWSDNRQSWLARAARRAGISHRQAKALFYGEITDPHHKSARLMRDAAERFTSVYQRQCEHQREQLARELALTLALLGPDHPAVRAAAAVLGAAREVRGGDDASKTDAPADEGSC